MPLPSYDPAAVDWRAVLARFGILVPPLLLLLGSLFVGAHRQQDRALRDMLLERLAARLAGEEARIREVLDEAAPGLIEAVLRSAALDGAGVYLLVGSDVRAAAVGGTGAPAMPDAGWLQALGSGHRVDLDEGLLARVPIPVPGSGSGQALAFLPRQAVDARCRALHVGLGGLFGILAGGIVVTAWFVARYAAQRDESSRRAFQAERLAAIGEAMTGLAHESRNAIQRGQACIEMLAKRVQHVPAAPQLLARLQAAQEDLHQLYERVRSYAAPVPLNLREADLRQVLDDAWADLEPQWRARNAELTVTSPDAATACCVDPFAMRRAFCNILDNALSVENDEGVARDRVRVHATFTRARLNGAAAITVSIRDNGPGLSDEQMRRVFQPFFTTRSRGTGLGMAITRRIVEMHGGRIQALRDGPGAHFQVTVPVAAAPAHAPGTRLGWFRRRMRERSARAAPPIAPRPERG